MNTHWRKGEWAMSKLFFLLMGTPSTASKIAIVMQLVIHLREPGILLFAYRPLRMSMTQMLAYLPMSISSIARS